MADKLIGKMDIPKSVRIDERLRAKMNVVMELRGRTLAQQVRHSIGQAVDQEFEELGKKAIDLFCRQMSEAGPQPTPKPALSANVGGRREMSANVGNREVA